MPKQVPLRYIISKKQKKQKTLEGEIKTTYYRKNYDAKRNLRS